jgi:hypothetical protein
MIIINILLIIFIILIFSQVFLFKSKGNSLIEGYDSNINVFNEALKDVSDLEQKILGPTYPYYKNIRTPGQLGMSDRGTLDALATDVNGLINYVTFLIQGRSSASVTGNPLGNKFFLKTGAKCLDTKTNKEVDRYIYVNNVPNGNIPIITQGLGVNFSEFKGLIPGAISNLNVLNPYSLMQSFMSGTTPACQPLTMETIDVNNNRSSQTNYVTLVDIQNMDACNFSNRKNPITGKNCVQTFQTMTPNDSSQISLPQDPVAQLYYLCLSAVAIYILYRLVEKSN